MGNKQLERIKALLELGIQKTKKEPDKDTFIFFNCGVLSLPTHPLFKDNRGLIIAGEKIALDTNKVINFECVPSKPLTVNDSLSGGGYKYVFYIGDTAVLKKEYEKVKSELENIHPNFILDTKPNLARLYVEAKPDAHYEMKKGSLRYKLLSFLAKQKKFIATTLLAERFDVDKEKIWGTVDDVRGAVNKKCHISRESLFENDASTSTGYRVTNVKIFE
jgi:hypothetical protein